MSFPSCKSVGLGVGVALAAALGLFSAAAQAQGAAAENVAQAASAPLAVAAGTVTGRDGKLLLTGGVSSIDGAAGGGLTPWAVTGSYASAGQIGASAYLTRLNTRDHGYTGYGAAFSLGEQLELSVGHQDFDTGATGTALGLPGLHLKLDIVGVKLHVAGDAVLDSDRWMPQIALGVVHKRLDAGGLKPTLEALDADRADTELYVSATKLLLAPGLLLNGTVRATRANQNGLLGFGGSGHRSYQWLPEVSVAWLLRKDLALGMEYRVNPDNLNPSLLGDGLRADDWMDAFVAYAPNKNLSFTLAWVDLGAIVPAVAPRRQRGLYLSAQITP